MDVLSLTIPIVRQTGILAHIRYVIFDIVVRTSEVWQECAQLQENVQKLWTDVAQHYLLQRQTKA